MVIKSPYLTITLEIDKNSKDELYIAKVIAPFVSDVKIHGFGNTPEKAMIELFKKMDGVIKLSQTIMK